MSKNRAVLASHDVSGSARLNVKRKLPCSRRVTWSAQSQVAAHSSSVWLAAQAHINPEQRSNKWTVCLTSKGVIAYLNKRISPLGAHALFGRCLETPCPIVNTVR